VKEHSTMREVLHAQARVYSLGRRRWMPNFGLTIVVVWSSVITLYRDCNHKVYIYEINVLRVCLGLSLLSNSLWLSRMTYVIISQL
jgi:hypothetical protein